MDVVRSPGANGAREGLFCLEVARGDHPGLPEVEDRQHAGLVKHVVAGMWVGRAPTGAGESTPVEADEHLREEVTLWLGAASDVLEGFAW